MWSIEFCGIINILIDCILLKEKTKEDFDYLTNLLNSAIEKQDLNAEKTNPTLESSQKI